MLCCMGRQGAQADCNRRPVVCLAGRGRRYQSGGQSLGGLTCEIRNLALSLLTLQAIADQDHHLLFL